MAGGGRGGQGVTVGFGVGPITLDKRARFEPFRKDSPVSARGRFLRPLSTGSGLNPVREVAVIGTAATLLRRPPWRT